jgi:hypothetical protein
MSFIKARAAYYDQRNGYWISGEEIMVNLTQIVTFSLVNTGTQDTSKIGEKIFELSLNNDTKISRCPLRVTSKYLENWWQDAG